MQMWKMFSWVGKSVAAGLIVSFLSIWTTGYIVNSYVESLLKQYHLPIEVQPFAMSGVWGKLWGADPGNGGGKNQTAERDKADETIGAGGNNQNGGGEAAPATAAETSALSGAPGDGDIASIEGDGAVSASAEGSAAAEEAAGHEADSAANDGTGSNAEPAAAGGSGTAAGSSAADSAGGDAGSAQPSGTQKSDAPGEKTQPGNASTPAAGGEAAPSGAVPVWNDEAVVTTDEMLSAKTQMSASDKDKLFDLLISKLPQKELQNISTYVENGLTETELNDVQQIVAKYLNRNEYDQMMSILKKY
jgi:hypothetical protein